MRQNNQGRWYVKTTIEKETKIRQIPDIWFVSARSGSDKTDLNLERDILRVGLIKSQFILQLPEEIDMASADIKPSYDIFVMAAMLLSASLYAPKLIEEKGSPLFHFHGYPSAKWFDTEEHVTGMHNPSLPCVTRESGIFNFLAMHDLAIKYGNNIKLASFVEPDHGVNIISNDLEYLINKLVVGCMAKQIELGGKFLPLLKRLENDPIT